MTSATSPGARRTDALTRDRIVEAAIEILDTAGESSLTFRALTARLSTGAGAIYHHVANKEELLAAAANTIVVRLVTSVTGDEEPNRAIRTLSLGIFTAIDAHPWLGTQLNHAPAQPAVLQIWKAIGLQLQRMGVAGSARSDAGAAIVNYILGSAAQFAAGARLVPLREDRATYLKALAEEWAALDPDAVVGEAANLLAEHDDQAQFLAGVDIFLAGVAAVR